MRGFQCSTAPPVLKIASSWNPEFTPGMYCTFEYESEMAEPGQNCHPPATATRCCAWLLRYPYVSADTPGCEPPLLVVESAPHAPPPSVELLMRKNAAAIPNGPL